MNSKNESEKEWYFINNIDTVDSPALVIYWERVVENIRLLTTMIDDVKRLRPHVKTHKSKEAALLMMEAGISKFKCATIAEAEMLAMVNAPDVLLAYQPVGPKLKRFIALIKNYPATTFSCLVDDYEAAKSVAKDAVENNLEIAVYIDLNVGMNRTGIAAGNDAVELYKGCVNLKGIKPVGLHAYDGHIRIKDFEQRSEKCNEVFKLVESTRNELINHGFPKPVIIAGGSPTFPVHAKRRDVECSPGTFIYWDAGYQRICPEQPFLTAALVISRIISFPGKNIICLDLGHKSIAAENELANRVTFLNAANLKFVGQSEEHLVAEVPEGHSYKTGDVLYGLPVHICPTVALYERALIVKNREVAEEWKTIARDRKINV
ncbi:D-TA family PLP-dependent enzyme [Segetibacter koreensis]|uniref:D-TA family PLP-dependent enzyme n=1 Tax=Segetibacter koreensis TaxID=398037 RepID=UPI000368A6B4|nr:D-TA family PLP-dependent enzyme [Segetibacter koreensis]